MSREIETTRTAIEPAVVEGVVVDIREHGFCGDRHEVTDGWMSCCCGDSHAVDDFICC